MGTLEHIFLEPGLLATSTKKKKFLQSSGGNLLFHHISSNKTGTVGHMSRFFYVIDCEIKAYHIGHNDATSAPSNVYGSKNSGLSELLTAATEIWLPSTIPPKLTTCGTKTTENQI